MTTSSVGDLSSAEQLLLLACRRSLRGRVAGPCVELAWRLGCGDRLGAPCSRAFLAMICTLDAGGRRPIHLLAPHELDLTTDERSVLELVAACQAGARSLAVSLTSWLVRHPYQQGLLGAADSLAGVMQASGLGLGRPGAFRAHLGACA